MTISVSGSLSTPSSVAEPVSAPSAVTQRKHKTAAPADVETVKLSQSEQVRLLKQQGQSPSQIASNLSIPMATVDGYLLAIPVTGPTAPGSRTGPSPVVASQPPAKG